MRADSDARKSHRPIELYVILDEGLLGSADIERTPQKTVQDTTQAVIQGKLQDVLRDVLRGGADAVQFRAKYLSKRAYYEIASDLIAITRQFDIPFFVNDHLDVALALSADGIHLGQNDLPLREARKLAPPGMLIGISTHSLEEAGEAADEGADYVAIGSVFPTSTKENPEAIIGTAMVAKVKKHVGDVPLIAIGGIDAANVGEVIRAGADGVAVASAVILADDPRAAAKELKEKIRAARGGTA